MISYKASVLGGLLDLMGVACTLKLNTDHKYISEAFEDTESIDEEYKLILEDVEDEIHQKARVVGGIPLMRQNRGYQLQSRGSSCLVPEKAIAAAVESTQPWGMSLDKTGSCWAVSSTTR